MSKTHVHSILHIQEEKILKRKLHNTVWTEARHSLSLKRFKPLVAKLWNWCKPSLTYLPRIQQPNKCCMARTTFAQSVQAQISTRKSNLPCQEPLYFFSVYCSSFDWVWMSLFIGSMAPTKLLPKLIWLIRSIILMWWVLQD